MDKLKSKITKGTSYHIRSEDSSMMVGAEIALQMIDQLRKAGLDDEQIGAMITTYDDSWNSTSLNEKDLEK